MSSIVRATGMKRNNIALLGISLVLPGIVALRELGVVDADLYASRLSASQSATLGGTHHGDNERFSYGLTIKYKDQTIHSQTQSYNDLALVEIEATLEEPVYSGICALPLNKDFKLAYQCRFTTVRSPSERAINGRIEGEVAVVIQGICSRRKAKELAFEEARTQIIAYFQNQLNH